jgi:hypothetical protein
MKAYHRHSLISGAIVFLFSICLTPFTTMAAENSRAMFQGLKSVYVHVNPIDSKTEQKGVVASQLRKETEQQLRKAGIEVLSQEEFNRYNVSLKYPLARLSLSVSMEEIFTEDTALDVSSISVEVQQAVFLGRNARVSMFATTWERNQISFGGSSEVRSEVRSFVGEFISAYTAANR